MRNMSNANLVLFKSSLFTEHYAQPGRACLLCLIPEFAKFWLALPRDAWGPAFVKLEYDLDVDNLDFFHLDFLHLETLVHQLSNSLSKLS